MGPPDFHDLMQARPFRPFRLRLSSGETIDVKEPFTGFSMSTHILVGTDYNEESFPTRNVFVPYSDLAGYEYLNPLASAG